MKAHDFGRRSEELACDFLQRRGWQILDRNFRAGHKEIDIVAQKGETVAFVEVKARSTLAYGVPSEFVNWQKQGEVARAARVWLQLHPTPDLEYRFDIIAIARKGNSHSLEHIENAWRIR